MAPSFARSTYIEYASRATFGRRLASGPFSPTCEVIVTSGQLHIWRRGWDSNPRYSCPYTAFPVPHLRPLGHPSRDKDPHRGTARPSGAGALRRRLEVQNLMAEGRGFEPPRDLRPYPISSRTPSTGLGHPSAPLTLFSFERTRSGALRTPRRARQPPRPPGGSGGNPPAAGTASGRRPPSDPPRRRRRARRAR